MQRIKSDCTMSDDSVTSYNEGSLQFNCGHLERLCSSATESSSDMLDFEAAYLSSGGRRATTYDCSEAVKRWQSEFSCSGSAPAVPPPKWDLDCEQITLPAFMSRESVLAATSAICRAKKSDSEL